MKRVCFAIGLLLVALNGNAQVRIGASGAQAAGMADIGLFVNNQWSVFGNQGALSFMNAKGLGFSSTNYFGVQQISSTQLCAATTISNAGVIGFGFQHFYFSEIMNTQLLGITMARKFSDKVGIGLQLAGSRYDIENYGIKYLLSANLGFQYVPNSKVAVSCEIKNLTNTRLADFNDERLMQSMTAGVRYSFTDNLRGMLQTSVNMTNGADGAIGMEYRATEKLEIRTGYSFRSRATSFGLTLALKGLNFHLATSWHQQLGLSPTAGFDYEK